MQTGNVAEPARVDKFVIELSKDVYAICGMIQTNITKTSKVEEATSFSKFKDAKPFVDHARKAYKFFDAKVTRVH